jgi:hypothetical protein
MLGGSSVSRRRHILEKRVSAKAESPNATADDNGQVVFKHVIVAVLI